MKAVAFQEFGASDKLSIQDVPLREVRPDEVLIRIKYTSVNPVDWKIREGHLQEMLPHQFPIVPGWDAAGVVQKVGEKVQGWEPGQEVMAYTRLPKVHAGTYAEFICLPADYLAAVPENIKLEEAAAIPLVGLTAYQALHKVVELKRGENVLITAGAGGVGSLAIQFAKIAGAHVTATGRATNHGYMKELGADHCVDYTAEDSLEQLKSVAPEGFAVVFDGAGGKSLNQAWEVLAPKGRLVSIVDTPDASAHGRDDVAASFHFVEPNGDDLSKITNFIKTNTLKLPAISVRSVQEAAAAQDENQQRRVRGKVVLKIDF